MKHIILTALLLGLTVFPRPAAAGDAGINTLTEAEKAAGWKLLFNGTDATGWHNFRREGIRPGWQIKDGALVCVDPHNAGDIVTTDQFDWFELQLDYNISEAGNSGIMYHVTDAGGAVWMTAPNSNWKTTPRRRTRSVAAGCMRFISRRLTPRREKYLTPPSRRRVEPRPPADHSREVRTRNQRREVF